MRVCGNDPGRQEGDVLPRQMVDKRQLNLQVGKKAQEAFPKGRSLVFQRLKEKEKRNAFGLARFYLM